MAHLFSRAPKRMKCWRSETFRIKGYFNVVCLGHWFFYLLYLKQMHETCSIVSGDQSDEAQRGMQCMAYVWVQHVNWCMEIPISPKAIVTCTCLNCRLELNGSRSSSLISYPCIYI